MKHFTKTLFLFLLILSCCCMAPGQKRSKRTAITQRAICKVTSVPKGFVVVGYKIGSAACSGRELVVIRAADADIVCADSPIPDGYSVIGQAASNTCVDPLHANPLTNALAIVHGDAPTPTPRRRNGSGLTNDMTSLAGDNDEDEAPPRSSTRITVSLGGQNNEPAPKSRAAAIGDETRIELAALHHEIVVGMTTSQVLSSWGLPSRDSATTESGRGTGRHWVYERGGQEAHLFFREDTLTSYTWNH